MTEETVMPVEPVAALVPDVPVEPVADSAPAETTIPPDDAGPPAEDGNVPESVQKRIDKAIGKMREHERKAAALEARNDELIDLLVKGGTLKPPGEPPAPTELKKPTLAEFDYDEAKYEAALDRYFEAKAESVVERKLGALKTEAQESRARESYQSREKVFAQSVPDFEEVAYDPTLPVSQSMADVIRTSEVGPALLYHLGQNRDVATQIAKLPPHVAAYELGKIEARIAQPKAPAAPKPQVTKAPPPPPTVETSDVPVEKTWQQMTDAEFARWRKRQIAQRR